MKFKNINLIYFSPTGGTKKVTDIIYNNCSFENVTDIDLCDKSLDFSKFNICNEDLSIISVPSYGGRVPSTAVERLNNICGNGSKAIIIVTYGNRHYDDTFLELNNFLIGKDFKVIAGIAAVCRHSIMKEIAKERPDSKDIIQLNSFAKKIEENNFKENIISFPGNVDYKDFPGVPFKPFALENCITCGKCAEFCPVGAIPVEDPSETLNDICITCMRCVNICPVNARTLGDENIDIMIKKFGPHCEGHKENILFV